MPAELFWDRLGHACDNAERPGEPLSFLFIDLDEFDDTFGPLPATNLLVEVRRRLTEQLRASDTAARIGGDELAVLLTGHVRAGAVERPSAILEALRRPTIVDGRDVVIGASIGIADDDAGRGDPRDISPRSTRRCSPPSASRPAMSRSRMRRRMFPLTCRW